VKNEGLHRVEEERKIVHTNNEGRLGGVVTSWVATAFLKALLKER
jgi:hypothetical protein